MAPDQLEQLYRLLDEWVMEPDWDHGSGPWQTLVEAKRQVLIELRELGDDVTANRLSRGE